MKSLIPKQVSELVYKREREVKRLFIQYMTRSLLAAELTLAEFKILFRMSVFVLRRASAACFCLPWVRSSF